MAGTVGRDKLPWLEWVLRTVETFAGPQDSPQTRTFVLV